MEEMKMKYKCEECGTENNEKDTATIVKAKTPAPLLPHSFASSSLATEVIYQKYYMGVPLYRQEKVWDDNDNANGKRTNITIVLKASF